MSYLLSKEQLNSLRNETHFISTINESINARKRNAYTNEVTVFLSHKHSDKAILENVVAMLKK